MKIFQPIEVAVAGLRVQVHDLFTFVGLDHASGWTWALSIVGLTVVIRALLIPLFVKQIRSQRGMQMVQPEMKKIQQKYKGRSDSASRQAIDRKSTRLNSSHVAISYAVFCLKKKIATNAMLCEHET